MKETVHDLVPHGCTATGLTKALRWEEPVVAEVAAKISFATTDLHRSALRLQFSNPQDA